MNAPNIKWSIVNNVLKPVTSALKNAGKWQKTNNDQPLPMTIAEQAGLSVPSLPEDNKQERNMTMKESESVTKDPICGMTVDEATALHAERDGKTFYFCSDHCQQKFLSTPAGAKPEGKSGGCCS